MTLRPVLLGVLAAALVATAPHAQVVDTIPYDHIHLAVPDPDTAYDWYIANLHGQPGESAGRVIFERFDGHRPLPVQMLFIKSADAKPSDGGTIDNIGFSVDDVAATVKTLEAAGAKVVTPVSDVPGLWKHAVVVDPWGVKIELVNDQAHPGFHHITLRVADPDATFRWFTNTFGGAQVTLGGQLDALRYDDTFLIVTKGIMPMPSQGRAIDHLGFTPPGMDAFAADLAAQHIPFATPPSAKPNQFGHRIAFIDAPGGVRIEVVDHAECAWGKAN